MGRGGQQYQRCESCLASRYAWLPGHWEDSVGGAVGKGKDHKTVEVMGSTGCLGDNLCCRKWEAGNVRVPWRVWTSAALEIPLSWL